MYMSLGFHDECTRSYSPCRDSLHPLSMASEADGWYADEVEISLQSIDHELGLRKVYVGPHLSQWRLRCSAAESMGSEASHTVIWHETSSSST